MPPRHALGPPVSMSRTRAIRSPGARPAALALESPAVRFGLCDVGGLTACRLLESSADLHDVRDCLGHANITTTSRYVRSTPVRLAQALERMEAAAETDAED